MLTCLAQPRQRGQHFPGILAQHLAAGVDELQFPLDPDSRAARGVPPDGHGLTSMHRCSAAARGLRDFGGSGRAARTAGAPARQRAGGHVREGRSQRQPAVPGMLIVAGRLFTPGSASGDNGQWARRRASIAVRIHGQPPCSATAFLPSRTAPTRAAGVPPAAGRNQYASGGLYTPHTSRSASQTSPTVARARSASRSG